MVRNYLEATLRRMRTNLLFSCINLFGLGIGLASVILIGLYVNAELGYDRYHPDAERLYRISRDFYSVNGSEELLLAANAAPAAELLKVDFPEIEATARVYGGRALLSRDDVAFFDDAIKFVDPAFLDMFHFEWIAGDPATALAQPLNIVLTESTARRYFGDNNPLGETLEFENVLPLTVTGVIRDLPTNTHLSANALASLEPVLRRFGEQARTRWDENISFHTYIKLAPGVSIQTIEERLPAFVDRHIGENASRWTGLSAMAVTDIHLHSTRQFDMKPPGSMATVITLITVASGILVIACFNFMNLSTALSALRSREVGVRKSVGARRTQLIWQFLGEALGMTLIATLIAVVIVELLMPAFNGFTGKTLAFDLLSDGQLQASLLLLVLLVGCGAGAYPAFYLSAFSPAKVLKSRMNTTAGGLAFRNLLVVLQFAISIALVIATAVVLLQTRYVREREPGFTREQVIILNGPPSQGVTQQWEALKAELLSHPDIVEASASNLVPGQENLNSFSVRRAGETEDLDFPLPFMFVDYDFFQTYEVPLFSGRTFSEDFPNDRVEPPMPNTVSAGNASDQDALEAGAPIDTVRPVISGNFVLNASAARDFGWSPEEAVDQVLDVFRNGYMIRGRVVGVVGDSHFESLRFNVKPTMFILTPAGIWLDGYPTLASASIRISGSNMIEALNFIDQTWEKFIPEFPVTRSFLSERMEALYREDSRLGQLYSYFSVLAILIACLGLFGLATFNAQRRTKEIGVRKVMGGSVWSIVWLLTNDFSKLVLLANLIAWPAAYFAMNRWLENFAYRIDLTPLIFIGSGLIALCIAWVTVGGTAAKAASAKPVLALRYE